MPTDEKRTYEIQSEENPDKWYHVVLEKRDSWIKAGCTCAEHIWHGQDCKHIKRAMECYELGL